MNIGLRRIFSPENYETRVFQIPGSVVFVITQSESRGLEPAWPAEVSVDTRVSTIGFPEFGPGTVQQSLGTAGRVIEQRLGPIVGAKVQQPFADTA